MKSSFCSHFRRSSAGSGEPWTPPRTPTTRTRLLWWSVWTAWRRFCSGPVRTAWTASRAGRRVRPRSSPPPVWFSTTARGSSPTFRTEVRLFFFFFLHQNTSRTDSDHHFGPLLVFIFLKCFHLLIKFYNYIQVICNDYSSTNIKIFVEEFVYMLQVTEALLIFFESVSVAASLSYSSCSSLHTLVQMSLFSHQ